MENDVSNEKSMREYRKEHFEKLLVAYNRAITDKPNLKAWYENEILLFKNTVADPRCDFFSVPSEKIAEVCMYIAYKRVLAVKKNGRVCGTPIYLA